MYIRHSLANGIALDMPHAAYEALCRSPDYAEQDRDCLIFALFCQLSVRHSLLSSPSIAKEKIMALTVFFSPARPSVVCRLRDGPLGPHIDEYARHLAEQGLARGTTMRTLHLVADLSRWLKRNGSPIERLDEATLQSYRSFRARRRRSLGDGDPIALRRLLGWMREMDICAAPPPAPLTHQARVQADYVRYLSQEIGLSARTLEHYTGILAPFLREHVGIKEPRWSTLTAAQVFEFFEDCARQRSTQYLHRLRSALRSFLRYLHYRGETPIDLSNSIPRTRRWRETGLPRHLSAEQVRRVLRSCDRTTAAGRRDYAILLSLARLGLRAIEVCTLKLDDIDWQTGQLLLNAKGRERASMPLPPEVGKALCDYLRNGRPRSLSRRVFLRHNAPHVGFSKSGCISTVVKRAMLRAGIDMPFKGAHVLRHTLATQMLGRGASLSEIGYVLRHQRPNTTRIYAKVDVPTLRSVALPWPEDAP